ncbi:MAG: hypothetical protein K0B15_15500 [Lentimicrobium sp.]|nr:hypothetical protein [Lentimicrobium sp.]
MKLLKAFAVTLAIVVVVYLAFGFSFGGFGNKPIKPLFSDPADSSLLFAHRGVTENFPENSLESIGEAKRLGFGAVEFDLRKSANGDFILFHDTDCHRMLGNDFEIQVVPTADLKTFPLLFNEKPTPCFVPTLEEVLNRHHEDFIFYFDMKLSGFKEADQIAEIIGNADLKKRVIVASANALFIFYIEFRYPEIITALEGFNAGKEWTYSLIPKKLKPDFLSGFFGRIDENHAKWLQERNLLNRRIVYGVDSSNYTFAREMGIRHMIIDYDSVSPAFENSGFGNSKE